MILPCSWDEISPEQFVDVCSILSKNSDEYCKKIKTVWVLSGESDKKFIQFLPEEIEEHFDKISFISDFKFKRSFFPLYKDIIGPKDNMSNLCFDQWVIAEYYYGQWHKTKDEKFADKIISAIYPKSEFDVNNIRFYDVHEEWIIKNALLMNYLGLRLMVCSCYPDVFTKVSTFEDTSVLNPYDKLVDDLAGPKFGQRKEVGKNKVHDVFIHLQNNEEKRKQAEIEKVIKTQ
jgi:hypothetical protein